jgi:hypothetical protein
MSKLPVRESRKPLSPKTEATLSLIQALFPIVASLATAIWAVNSYLDQQRSTNITRLLEARKPFSQKQFETYSSVSDLVGRLATLPPDSPDWAMEKIKFDMYRFSSMSMVQDGGVERQMEALTMSLQEMTFHPKDQILHLKLQTRAFCLAQKMRSSIENSWSIQLQSSEAIFPQKLIQVADEDSQHDPCYVEDPVRQVKRLMKQFVIQQRAHKEAEQKIPHAP